MEYTVNDKMVFLFDTLLSQRESSNFLKIFDGVLDAQIHDTLFPPAHLRVDSTIWASVLSNRIIPKLPIHLRTVVGINHRFYYTKVGGGFFGTADTATHDGFGNIKIMTLFIFLNDTAMVGGEIDLLDVHGNLQLRVIPVAGRGLLIDRDIPIRNTPVVSGVRYILQTDIVMYNQEASSRVVFEPQII
jgi:hypothetical protein